MKWLTTLFNTWPWTVLRSSDLMFKTHRNPPVSWPQEWPDFSDRFRKNLYLKIDSREIRCVFLRSRFLESVVNNHDKCTRKRPRHTHVPSHYTRTRFRGGGCTVSKGFAHGHVTWRLCRWKIQEIFGLSLIMGFHSEIQQWYPPPPKITCFLNPTFVVNIKNICSYLHTHNINILVSHSSLHSHLPQFLGVCCSHCDPHLSSPRDSYQERWPMLICPPTSKRWCQLRVRYKQPSISQSRLKFLNSLVSSCQPPQVHPEQIFRVRKYTVE